MISVYAIWEHVVVVHSNSVHVCVIGTVYVTWEQYAVHGNSVCDMLTVCVTWEQYIVPGNSRCDMGTVHSTDNSVCDMA